MCNIFIIYDTVTTGGWSGSKEFYNCKWYIILCYTITDYLFRYNFTTNTETALHSALGGDASLNSNPNDDNMYYDLQIYFIDNNTIVYDPNITYDHATSPSIVNNHYLYVTGRRQYIERLDLNGDIFLLINGIIGCYVR